MRQTVVTMSVYHKAVSLSKPTMKEYDINIYVQIVTPSIWNKHNPKVSPHWIFAAMSYTAMSHNVDNVITMKHMKIRIFGASMILAVYALLVTKYFQNGRVLGCYFLPVNVSMCGVQIAVSHNITTYVIIDHSGIYKWLIQRAIHFVVWLRLVIFAEAQNGTMIFTGPVIVYDTSCYVYIHII